MFIYLFIYLKRLEKEKDSKNIPRCLSQYDISNKVNSNYRPLRSSSPNNHHVSSLSSSSGSSPLQANRKSLKDLLAKPMRSTSGNQESDGPYESFSRALARENSSLSSRSCQYPHYNFKPAGYVPPNFPAKKHY